MRYLLLVCWDRENMDAQTEPEPDPDKTYEFEEGFDWVDDLRARGIWITGDQLTPPRRARSVRVRDGKRMVTDGPFAETKEAVGGFYVVDCDDRDDALDLAARVPASPGLAVEVLTIAAM